MVKVGICIPWRSTPGRARHLPTVQAQFANTLPDAKVYLADSGHEVFSRSASMNQAVRDATEDGCDLVVISGADLLLDGDLPSVVRQAADGQAHIAYTHYIGLSRQGTEQLYRTGQWRGCHVEYRTDGACAGFIVMQVDTYWHLGGHDETYVGWGYEDVDFAIRAQFVRHPGTSIGLWHEPDVDRAHRSVVNAGYFRQKNGNV